MVSVFEGTVATIDAVAEGQPKIEVPLSFVTFRLTSGFVILGSLAGDKMEDFALFACSKDLGFLKVVDLVVMLIGPSFFKAEDQASFKFLGF